MTLAKEAADFIRRMKEAEPQRPRLAAQVARLMLAHAPLLARLHERECSDPSYGARDQKRADRMMTEINDAVALLNEGRPEDPSQRWEAEEQGDPRGYALMVRFPGRDVYNTFGGREAGFGVYSGRCDE